MSAWLDRIPWWLIAMGVLTLGLAPFVPEPHIWEKAKLLLRGSLMKPIDIFDLLLHAIPWLVALSKAARAFAR